MPRPYEGEPIIFWNEGIRVGNPNVGIVLKVNPGTIQIRSMNSLQFRDGLRHADDPMLKTGEQAANGSWDFSEQGKKFRALLVEAKIPVHTPPKAAVQVAAKV